MLTQEVRQEVAVFLTCDIPKFSSTFWISDYHVESFHLASECHPFFMIFLGVKFIRHIIHGYARKPDTNIFCKTYVDLPFTGNVALPNVRIVIADFDQLETQFQPIPASESQVTQVKKLIVNPPPTEEEDHQVREFTPLTRHLSQN